jgi:hypothetical protein
MEVGMRLGFMECDSCREKSGAPCLCNGCLHNRTVIETLTEDKKSLIEECYHLRRDRWAKVCASEVFQELKHGKYREVMFLLQQGEISIGKAAEAIAELAHGVKPLLPKVSPGEIKHVKE